MIPTAAGCPQKVREQVAAGLRRIVDRDRLAGKQEAVEVLLDQRLGAEALGELGRLRVARLAALDDCEDASREGRGQQDRDPGEQRAKAPVRAARPFVSRSETSRLSVTNSRSSSLRSSS